MKGQSETMENVITQDAAGIVPLLFTVDEMLTWAVVRGILASRDEVEWMCSRVGRNPACVLLSELDHNGLLEPDAYLLTGDIWSTSEYPDAYLDPDDWRSLFDEAGYTVDGVRAAYPDQPVQLWRGSVPERRDHWSWTDDRTVAVRYASGGFRRQPGKLWTATVDPWRLLAQNTDRAEAEYVVDTDGLDIAEEEFTPVSET